MTIIVTGAAGFIGSHVSKALLERGEKVLGIDEMNDYYDPALKQARLALLDDYTQQGRFTFVKESVHHSDAIKAIVKEHEDDITGIIHLAAQAGVRYSIDHPLSFAESNLTGHLVMLEVARHLPNLKHFIYASSSSVYGDCMDVPFKLSHDLTKPVSLYAATKAADELLTYTYCHLFGFPATGLRFFTVYGPWGRPDMAYYLFADAITENRPIQAFGQGKLRRDFTYIDDIVDGTLKALDNPAPKTEEGAAHRVFNLGSDKSELLTDFIATIEDSLGQKATIELKPMQPGDVHETAADLTESQKILGYAPKTMLKEGIENFITWYKSYHNK